MKRNPALFTLVAAGVFLVVSAPLAFIIGTFTIIASGSLLPGISSVNAGIVVGALVSLLFVSWASYATYTWNAAQLEVEESGSEAL
jgi:hypothetical protein